MSQLLSACPLPLALACVASSSHSHAPGRPNGQWARGPPRRAVLVIPAIGNALPPVWSPAGLRQGLTEFPPETGPGHPTSPVHTSLLSATSVPRPCRTLCLAPV